MGIATSPGATLIKWFPDRPGLDTGMAIMGLGRGAMIASPLSRQDELVRPGYGGPGHRAKGNSVACVLPWGMVYLFALRRLHPPVPAEGWRRKAQTASVKASAGETGTCPPERVKTRSSGVWTGLFAT